jgi:hypothetical protein
MKTLKMKIALVCLASGVFGAAHVKAATVNASSCSASAVQSAINSASNGDTVSVPAGNCTWSSQINLLNAKGVSLIGAGAGKTVITVGTTGPVLGMDTITGTNNNFYRISGFTFTTTVKGAQPIWFYGYNQTATLANFRIDHNTFNNFVDGIGILLGETSSRNNFYGLIDHNNFTGSVNFLGLKLLGPGEGSPWRASPKGTAENLFIEDNVWDFDTATSSTLGSGCIDAWMSGSLVFRHNTTKNCLVTSHGVIHGGGTISLEAYDNLLQRTAGSGGMWEDGTRLFHHQGSGETIFFNNQFKAASGKSGGAIGMTHYRSADPSAAGYSGPRCDGTASIDGNMSPQSTYYGYPCNKQPGRMAGNKLSPMYFWNNRWSDTGAKIDVNIEDPWSSGRVKVHLVNNRDYYNAVSASAQTSSSSPFNGTAGMGFGTLANRPTTCTTNSLESGGGVGYWATDTNTLYRCSATNTWTVHYKPYTYPHPLAQSGGATTPSPSPLAPPTNLRVVP